MERLQNLSRLYLLLAFFAAALLLIGCSEGLQTPNSTGTGEVITQSPIMPYEIAIEHYVNGEDADRPTGPTVNVGEDILLTYKIINRGYRTLTNVMVSDPRYGEICQVASLPPFTPHVCERTVQAEAGQYSNTASVMARASDGSPHTDSDPVHYVGRSSTGSSSRLGDRVWLDRNRDGVQDANEPGIPGVTVELLNASGSVLRTTTTNAQGFYNFGDLPAAQYRVRISLPEGYQVTLRDQGENEARDSDVDPATLTTELITLGQNDQDLTWDAGLFTKQVTECTGRIGDYIWRDDNRNGVQDAGEPALVGVQVQLFDSRGNLLQVVSSDNQGRYEFTELCRDVYTVDVVESTLPSGLVGPTTPQAGDDDTVDSDVPLDGTAVLVELTQNDDEDLTIDFGYVPQDVCRSSLGDYVWNDSNRNGQQDNGEQGIAGVTVVLRDASGRAIMATTTDANGAYSFDHLCAGIYSVEVDQDTLPDGFVPTAPNQAGGNDTLDSDGPRNGGAVSVNLGENDDNPTIDFGYYATGQPDPAVDIEKYTKSASQAGLGADADTAAEGPQIQAGSTVVWTYVVRNTGNTPLVNVTVTDDQLGVICSVARLEVGQSRTCTKTGTARQGPYANMGTVKGTPLDENGVPQPDQVVEDNDPSHYTGTQPNEPSIDLEKATNGDDADAPQGPAITTGDTVTWTYRVTNTGNVTLTNVQLSDNRITLDNSGDDNCAVIPLLSPGQSVTCQATGTAVLGQYQNIATAQGTPVDSSGNPITDSSGNPITVSDSDPSHYIGVAPQKASLGNFVWRDLDRDGVQDDGEPGIPNVTVKLLDNGGNQIATTTTDANGRYGFTNLDPGQYAVMVVVPNGFAISPQNAGNDDAKDSDINGSGMTAVTTLEPGENDPTLDAGLYPLVGSIGDTVFRDDNQNGIQDNGEPGVPNVTVKLQDASGRFITSTVTDADGNYSFDNLPAGQYRVMVNVPDGFTTSPMNQGNDDSQDSDINPNDNNMTGVITLEPGETDDTVDAGIYPSKASLGDRVWEDRNRNGVQDNGEPGIANVTVKLIDAATGNTLATTTTSPSGIYRFDNLDPGNYRVMVNVPDGFSVSPKDQGVDNGSDSDIDPTNGMTDVIGLEAGENDLSWDAGLYRSEPSIDIRKQQEGADSRDVQEGSDVTFEIVVTNTGNVTLSNVQVSDPQAPDCARTFSRIDPGQSERYSCTVQRVTASFTNIASVTATDPTGKPVDPDEDPSTVNVTPQPKASLGDRVFDDKDRDGIQDDDEVGVPGVTVKLINAAGAQIATTTTDASGNYRFTDLTPGDYAVMIITPDGFENSPMNRGGDDSKDSDIDPNTGMTPLTNLAPGENDATLDAGIYQKPASLGDRVFRDDNQNGIQDGNELGVSGVTVKLLDGNNNPVTDAAGRPITTVTDASGNYTFTDLVPGTYKVMIDVPDGFAVSPKDRGNDDAQDSDIDPANNMSDPTTLSPGENDPTLDAGIYPLSSGLDIRKQEEGEDSRTITSGDDVTFTIVVTNTGQTTLRNVRVNDPQTPSCNRTIGTLTPGQNITYTCTAFNVTSDFTNVATVTGDDPTGTPVSPDEDPSTVDVEERPASLGDTVFRDDNQNGIQDAGEPGVPGVTVKLQDQAGNTLAQTTTDANGKYSFTNLTPGTYKIMVNVPSGFGVSPKDRGNNDATDSDINPATGMSDPTTLSPGEDDTSVDAGIYPLSSGLDIRKQAEGEDSREVSRGDDVTFTIVVTNIGNTTLTNVRVSDPQTGSCARTIGTLAPGQDVTYTCTAFNVSETFTNVAKVEGTDPIGDPVPSDEDPSTVEVEQPRASLGDRVWEDFDRDGIQDAGEPGVPGVTVKLQDAAGNVIAQDITDANGIYGFEGLEPGQYKVMVNVPNGYTVSPQDALGNSQDRRDSDIDPNNGMSDLTTLSPGEDDLSIDAGLYRTEPGIDIRKQEEGEDSRTIQSGQNVSFTITVTNTGNVPLTNVVVTDVQSPRCARTIGNLAVGQRINYTCTVDNVTSSFTNVAKVTGTAPDGTTPTDEDPSTVNVETPKASLGDRVWEDRDRDGIQDSGEPGIPNVVVKLQDPAGNTIAETTTNADGIYRFDDLDPGDYKVMVNPPAGYQVTTQDANNNTQDGRDSDIDPNTGMSDPTTLNPGENDNSIDAGLYPVRGSIDIRKQAEGADSRTVVSGDDVTFTIVVTNTGNVSLSNVQVSDPATPSCARVIGTLDVGKSTTYSCTATNVTSDFTNVARVTATDPTGQPVDPDDDPSSVVVEEPARASLGDRVWEDFDKDGVQDPGEPGVPGIVVKLQRPDGTEVARTTTDDNGIYRFTNLEPGDYKVMIITPDGFTNSPQGVGGDTRDSDINPDTQMTRVVTLAPGDVNNNLDAGIYPEDNNPAIDIRKQAEGPDSREIDSGDDVTFTVVVTNTGDVTLTNVQVTDPLTSNCDRLIGTLAPGKSRSYTCVATNIDASFTNIANVEGTAPDGSTVTDTDPSEVVVRPIGTPNIDIEKFTRDSAGNFQNADTPTGPTLTVGEDVVWRYVVTNNGDLTIRNIRVIDDIEGQITCPMNELVPGQRMVCEHTGTVVEGQYANQGGVVGQAVDSNGNPTGGQVVDTDPSHYTGTAPSLGSVGKCVFFDVNKDGIRQDEEPGVDGVTVRLVDGTGRVVATTQTDGAGIYMFNDVPAGDYRVEVSIPAGYMATLANVGSDDRDSDINSSGSTGTFTLAGGENIMNVDAGLKPTVTNSNTDPNGGTKPELDMAFRGKFDYITIGNSENVQEHHLDCRERNNTSAPLNVPPGATIKKAYLHWSGTGPVDPQVTLNGTTVVAQKTFTDKVGGWGYAFSRGTGAWKNVVAPLGYFFESYGAYADVTSLVRGSGVYSVDNLEWAGANAVANITRKDPNTLHCNSNGAYGAWSMIVIYEDESLPVMNLNVYLGFDGYFPTPAEAVAGNRDGMFNWNAHYILDNACGADAQVTYVVYDGDNYKGDRYIVNGQDLGDNTLNGTVAPNLDIDNVTVNLRPGQTSLPIKIINYHDTTLDQTGNKVDPSRISWNAPGATEAYHLGAVVVKTTSCTQLLKSDALSTGVSRP